MEVFVSCVVGLLDLLKIVITVIPYLARLVSASWVHDERLSEPAWGFRVSMISTSVLY
jgi:hypothetical protein